LSPRSKFLALLQKIIFFSYQPEADRVGYGVDELGLQIRNVVVVGEIEDVVARVGHWERLDITRPLDEEFEILEALEGHSVGSSEEKQEFALELGVERVEHLPELADRGR